MRNKDDWFMPRSSASRSKSGMDVQQLLFISNMLLVIAVLLLVLKFALTVYLTVRPEEETLVPCVPAEVTP